MDHSGYDRNASQPQQINIVPTAVPHFLKSPFSCLSFNVERAFQTELGLNFSHIKFPKFMSFCEQDNHMLYKMPNEKIFQHNSPKTNKYPFEVVPYILPLSSCVFHLLHLAQWLGLTKSTSSETASSTYRSAVHPPPYIPPAFYDAFFRRKSFAHILQQPMISRSHWEPRLYLALCQNISSGKIRSILKKIANLASSPDLILKQ